MNLGGERDAMDGLYGTGLVNSLGNLKFTFVR